MLPVVTVCPLLLLLLWPIVSEMQGKLCPQGVASEALPPGP